MKDADGSIEQSRLANFGPGHREDVADEHVLEVLGFAGGFAHEQDGGSGSNGVGDADKSFLGNVASAGASESKDSGAKKRERQADPIRGASMRVHAGDDGDGSAESRDLGKGQVHKNDPTLDHMHAGVAGDGVGSFEVEVRLNKNELYAVALHLADQLDSVLRARGDAGAGLDVSHDIEAKVFGEIGPGAVIGDDLAAGVGLHLREPFFIGLLEALLKGIVALGEIGGVARAHFGKFVAHAVGDAQAVLGIKPIVRVAERVDVTLGTGHLSGGNLEDFGKAGSVKVARRAKLNLRIGGLADERRKPADFQLESDDDEKIGMTKF